MPWLIGTALLHSLAVTERRGLFKGWTLLLAVSAFSLSLLGTFLVRSGVLVSVHAFATDPARGIHPGHARVLHRRRARPLCLARAPAGATRRLRALVAGNLPAGQQHAARRGDAADPVRYALSAVPRRAGARQDLRRAAVLQHGVHHSDPAAGAADGPRHAQRVEEDGLATAQGQALAVRTRGVAVLADRAADRLPAVRPDEVRRLDRGRVGHGGGLHRAGALLAGASTAAQGLLTLHDCDVPGALRRRACS
jgi:hypothetical protein